MQNRIFTMRSIALVLFLLLAGNIMTQNETNEPAKPLILIDTLLTYNESMILHPSKFVSISTMNGQKGIELYGVSGRFGVIKIQTLPNIEFIRLNGIFEKFQIEEKYRSLKVCIDKVPVDEPEKLLADIREIRTVEVSYEKLPATAGAKEPGFINIITQPVL